MDNIDKKILEELQKNSSQPLSELSKKVGLSNTPCWNRIKKLEEEKIIKSKSIIIDNKKINLSITVFLSISIQNHTTEWLKNFQKVVNKYDQIIEVHRLTGSNSDYQITILSPSIDEYDKIESLYKRLIGANLLVEKGEISYIILKAHPLYQTKIMIF